MFLKKKRIIVFVAALLAVLLCACKTNKEDVKLATKFDIIKYATTHYGLTKYIDSEAAEDGYAITYKLRDVGTGIEYEVTSAVTGLSIDGSVFGYTETKTSTFPNLYQDYVLDEFKEKNEKKSLELDVVDRFSMGYLLFEIDNVDPESVDQIAAYVYKTVKKIDKRSFFKDCKVELYSGEGTGYIGGVSMENGKFTNHAEEWIDNYKSCFAAMVNLNSGDYTDITYLYYEEMPLSEVPGVKNYELTNKKLTDDSIVVLYYFDYKGTTYFIGNFEVWVNHFDEYYSNYFENSNYRRNKN